MPGPKKKSKGVKRKNNPLSRIRRIEDITKDTSSFEVYGQVIKALGNRRFSVNVQNINVPSEITNIVCSLKGSYRRKITTDMFVLVQLFDFNTNQGQIIDSYSQDELQTLKSVDKWDYPEDVSKRLYGTAVFTNELPSSDDESASEDESEDQAEPEPIVRSVCRKPQENLGHLDLDIDAI